MNQPAPLGESGRELSSAEASAAIERWLKPPRLTLGAVSVTRQGRWVVLSISFRRAPWAGYTVRLSTPWAKVLRNHLSKVLDA